jgi:hypothetical protein
VQRALLRIGQQFDLRPQRRVLQKAIDRHALHLVFLSWNKRRAAEEQLATVRTQRFVHRPKNQQRSRPARRTARARRELSYPRNAKVGTRLSFVMKPTAAILVFGAFGERR